MNEFEKTDKKIANPIEKPAVELEDIIVMAMIDKKYFVLAGLLYWISMRFPYYQVFLIKYFFLIFKLRINLKRHEFFLQAEGTHETVRWKTKVKSILQNGSSFQFVNRKSLEEDVLDQVFFRIWIQIIYMKLCFNRSRAARKKQ